MRLAEELRKEQEAEEAKAEKKAVQELEAAQKAAEEASRLLAEKTAVLKKAASKTPVPWGWNPRGIDVIPPWPGEEVRWDVQTWRGAKKDVRRMGQRGLKTAFGAMFSP